MGAGDSASENARRQREKAARLNRSAELWEQGARGEQLVAAALAALGPEWAVIHDVRWPGRRFANIDHVAVGPSGIFVIDAKNWSGRITVTDGVLRQNGYRREKEVASCADAAIAVGEVLLDQFVHVKAVLCFVGDVQIDGSSRDVLLATTSTLAQLLASQPSVLGVAEIEGTIMQLRSRTVEASAGMHGPGRQSDLMGTRAIPRTMPVGTKPRRRSRVLPVLLGLACVPLALALMFAAIGLFAGAVSHLGAKPFGSAAGKPTPRAAGNTGFVVYKVYANGYQGARVIAWGQGRRGTLHLSNQALPWIRRIPKKDFALPVYVLSAMSTGRGGITCEIDVDGAVVARSSGLTSAFCD